MIGWPVMVLALITFEGSATIRVCCEKTVKTLFLSSTKAIGNHYSCQDYHYPNLEI